MYARFFRWASDRLAANGVLTFITIRSFIDSRTFDGFRKVVTEEFAEIRVVDPGGDVRVNPKLSGTKHNVFGIQTGVAISFLVKRAKHQGCRVFYTRRPELETAEEKLAFLGNAKLGELPFEEIQPDAKHNWINLTTNDFDLLMPIATKEAKAAKTAGHGKAIFKLFSFGVVTNRDEWVYADAPDDLAAKVRALIGVYNADVNRLRGERDTARLAELLDTSIKWTRAVKKDLQHGVRYQFDSERIVEALYRPFVKRWLYYSPQLNEMPNRTPRIFANGTARNPCLVLTDPTAQRPWMACSVDRLPDMHFVGAAAGTVCMPLERYGAQGQIEDNITDWALDQFTKHYQPGRGKKGHPLTKEVVFHYVYGVLHARSTARNTPRT